MKKLNELLISAKNPAYMTPEERALAEIYISRADMASLSAVAYSLSARYPGDWFERITIKPTLGRICLIMIGCGVALAAFGSPWWFWGLPLSIWVGFVLLVEAWFKRLRGAPRWAHHAAALGEQEMATAEAIVGRLKPVQRSRVHHVLPIRDGKAFWCLYSEAQVWVEGHT